LVVIRASRFFALKAAAWWGEAARKREQKSRAAAGFFPIKCVKVDDLAKEVKGHGL
jgi:hypothetical protein